MIFIFTISMAIANRWRGSGDNEVPKPIRYGAMAALFGLWGTNYTIGTGFAVMIWTYLAILIGHGRFMHMGRIGYRPDREDNWPAWLPRGLGIPRDTWLFDAVAMAVTGVALMMPAFMIGRPADLLCLILPAAGIFKPLCYELAWRTYSRDPIAMGELLFGAVVGLALGLTYQT